MPSSSNIHDYEIDTATRKGGEEKIKQLKKENEVSNRQFSLECTHFSEKMSEVN